MWLRCSNSQPVGAGYVADQLDIFGVPDLSLSAASSSLPPGDGYIDGAQGERLLVKLPTRNALFDRFTRL